LTTARTKDAIPAVTFSKPWLDPERVGVVFLDGHVKSIHTDAATIADFLKVLKERGRLSAARHKQLSEHEPSLDEEYGAPTAKR